MDMSHIYMLGYKRIESYEQGYLLLFRWNVLRLDGWLHLSQEEGKGVLSFYGIRRGRCE